MALPVPTKTRWRKRSSSACPLPCISIFIFISSEDAANQRASAVYASSAKERLIKSGNLAVAELSLLMRDQPEQTRRCAIEVLEAIGTPEALRVRGGIDL